MVSRLLVKLDQNGKIVAEFTGVPEEEDLETEDEASRFMNSL